MAFDQVEFFKELEFIAGNNKKLMRIIKKYKPLFESSTTQPDGYIKLLEDLSKESESAYCRAKSKRVLQLLLVLMAAALVAFGIVTLAIALTAGISALTLLVAPAPLVALAFAVMTLPFTLATSLTVSGFVAVSMVSMFKPNKFKSDFDECMFGYFESKVKSAVDDLKSMETTKPNQP